ncbi:malonyl-CoA decarboxylase [Azospirillum sp. RWY-5-1]|uniref:Malonyl-CoA decarboxylase n=1 Tax=Azospirillum oleiclasticum TaxID=2735135 RepID=A0ABX2T4Z5_9PROT|nr:malonyl-CoA decarboxylase [Azospirillum oleiclasticum]NYZ11036.1 malonyl-CoA decarboxylase [Azospirillum oleiclasticum]NYZ18198.1 malonyl-CoA decarboxylase [Azospirillum oleiclasticum]
MSETQLTAPHEATAPPAAPPPAVPATVPQPGLWDRALDNLRSRWREIAASARGAVGAPPRSYLPKEDAERLKLQMEACLEGRGGEVSARARAAQLGRTYLSLDPAGRRNFLVMLARDFDVDRAAVDRAMATFLAAGDPVGRGHAERALREALEPPRLRLLTQFNGLPDGVKFLVDLRAELMEAGRDEPLLEALGDDLKSLLKSWFDVGFLELTRITWDSPASLLEKLIKYEAVHEIRGWQDLKDRLDSDRRCFAFFHPRMPNEPLIFVEVALVQGLSADVQSLLDPTAPVRDPSAADTAIFYSISNAQKGLAGISFGNFLIKRVVDSLAAEFPNLKTFATLSPIPGFRRWLDRRIKEDGDGVLTEAERTALSEALGYADSGEDGAEPAGRLAAALALAGWHRDERIARALKGPLMRLGAVYLTGVEPHGREGRPRARDPVAHFHLSNGARMERLNWLADLSERGLRQSCGMMINYKYRLSEIDSNHEAYRGEGKVIASSAIRSAARAAG